MKILNFISGKDLGGSKQSFVLYSEALNNLGYDVTSLIKKNALVKNLLVQKKLKIIEISYYRLNFIFFRWLAIYKLKKTIEKLNIDLIFVHKQIDIFLLRKALGDKVIIIGVIHELNSKHINFSNQLIAVSTLVKNFLLNNGYKKNITVIPNMVKLESEVQYKNIKSIPLIGSMGIFRRTKGFHILIEALHILKTRGVDFKAVIAGKGNFYYSFYLKYLKFRYRLNELKIIDWIKNSERDRFLDNLDIFCLPSKRETFGMILIEAMMRMKVVIATKCGGAEEILTHNKNGFLIEKNSPVAMVNMIEAIINNQKNLYNISMNAHNFVKEHYEITKVQNKLDEIIKSFKKH